MKNESQRLGEQHANGRPQTRSGSSPVNKSKVAAEYRLRQELKPTIETVERHPVFTQFETFDGVRMFLEHFVYAVWDFKVLVEAFRNPEEEPNPFPGPSEILPLAEDKDWIYEMSHFDTVNRGNPSFAHLRPYHSLFIQSMEVFGANQREVITLMQLLEEGEDLNRALERMSIPAESETHLRTTWNIIQTDELARIAGALALGRRDIIPPEFPKRAKDLHPRSIDFVDAPFTDFRRGMELDRVEHVERILTDSRLPENWERKAEEGAQEMLEARLNLLDGIMDKIPQNDPSEIEGRLGGGQ